MTIRSDMGDIKRKAKNVLGLRELQHVLGILGSHSDPAVPSGSKNFYVRNRRETLLRQILRHFVPQDDSVRSPAVWLKKTHFSDGRTTKRKKLMSDRLSVCNTLVPGHRASFKNPAKPSSRESAR